MSEPQTLSTTAACSWTKARLEMERQTLAPVLGGTVRTGPSSVGVAVASSWPYSNNEQG